MYKAYDLKLSKDDFRQMQYFKTIGKKLYQENTISVQRSLDEFVNPDGVVDGSKIQAHWFPTIKADVFLSHSHSDNSFALLLAGWLFENFGLTSFIDSAVWGYAGDLLKRIDIKYCYDSDRDVYNYYDRNLSTSHVYLMLATALDMMIDETECLIFINTPKSIKYEDIASRTLSPWLYREITTASIIRRRIPKRRIGLHKFAEQIKIGKRLDIEYEVPLDILQKLTMSDLLYWYQRDKLINGGCSLDKLYEIKGK